MDWSGEPKANAAGVLKARVRHAAVALIALVGFVLFVLPLLLQHQPLWLLLLLPATLLSNSYWALLHEGLHGGLGRTSAENERLDRPMAILFGSAAGLLRAAHLGHHRFNRHTFDRPDAFEPARVSRIVAGIRYYWGMLFGLYLGEVAGPLACLLPRPVLKRLIERAFLPEEPGVAAYVTHALLDPRTLRQIRIDGVIACGFLALSFWLYGAWWPALALFLVGRGFLVGFVDNLYHYATPLDDRRFAWNLRLPHWASAMILYSNMHRQHHRRPGLAWHQLPSMMAAQGDRYDAGFFHMAARQMLGPIPADRLPNGGAASPTL